MDTLRFSTVNASTLKLFEQPGRPAKAEGVSQRVVAAGADGWDASYGSKASTALGNILAILSAKAQNNGFAVGRQDGLPADVAHYMAINDGTAEDALDVVKQTIADYGWANGTDMQRSLADAVANGTVSITNFSDLGVTTSTEHMLQFDTDGRLVGSAQSHDFHEATDFLERNFAFGSGGEALGFDRLTGRKATYVVTGNEYFYVRWT